MLCLKVIVIPAFSELLYTHNVLWVILFTYARFMGAMSICPLFSASFLSFLLRSSLSIVLSFFIYSSFKLIVIQDNLIVNLLIVLVNYLYGVLLGYILSFPIWLVESSGNLIDNQRGEQMGAIINQITNNTASSIGNLITKAFLIYLVINNGFLFFFETIFKSFLILPINNLLPLIDSHHISLYIKFVADYFYWVIVLILPIILILFLIDLLLGLISSFIPQINVTVISMPIKSLVAIFLLSLFIGTVFHNVFTKFLTNAYKVLQ